MSNEPPETCPKIIEVVDSRDLEAFSVQKNKDSSYDVLASGVPRHTGCTPEDVMRALGNYLQSLLFENEHLKYKGEF